MQSRVQRLFWLTNIAVPTRDSFFTWTRTASSSATEAAELDIDSMLARGTLIVEWAERIISVLPDERLWISLEYRAEEQRQMNFRANGARYDELLVELQANMFGAA